LPFNEKIINDSSSIDVSNVIRILTMKKTFRMKEITKETEFIAEN